MKLDTRAIQSAITTGLPRRARWKVKHTSIDFDFSSSRRTLRKLSIDDVVGGIDDEWADLLIIGDYDVANGGGAPPWIAVRETDSRIHGLDVERKDAVFLFNSSIESFVNTFDLLDEHLRQGRQLSLDIEACARDLDPDAYPVSEWRLLIEYLIAS